jgi:hypothetical protein
MNATDFIFSVMCPSCKGTNKITSHGWLPRTVSCGECKTEINTETYITSDVEEVKKGVDMVVAPHFNLFVDKMVVSGWLASQTDMLAKDWYILAGEG